MVIADRKTLGYLGNEKLYTPDHPTIHRFQESVNYSFSQTSPQRFDKHLSEGLQHFVKAFVFSKYFRGR